jgi:hypothetical protein
MVCPITGAESYGWENGKSMSGVLEESNPSASEMATFRASFRFSNISMSFMVAQLLKSP